MVKRTAKAKRTRPEALERRVESEGRSHPKRSEEVARMAKGRTAKRFREPLRRGSEDLDGEGARREADPLSEIYTECHVQL
jgi:hypothetical protein